MEHHDPSPNRSRSPKTGATSAPTEEELSRIARQAVRQPADPRLDSELAKMGLMDSAASPESLSGSSRSRPVAIGPELEQLRMQLRRTERILWLLVVVTGILAVLVGVLLVR